jgi:hypothetical protein
MDEYMGGIVAWTAANIVSNVAPYRSSVPVSANAVTRKGVECGGPLE